MLPGHDSPDQVLQHLADAFTTVEGSGNPGEPLQRCHGGANLSGEYRGVGETTLGHIEEVIYVVRTWPVPVFWEVVVQDPFGVISR